MCQEVGTFFIWRARQGGRGGDTFFFLTIGFWSRNPRRAVWRGAARRLDLPVGSGAGRRGCSTARSSQRKNASGGFRRAHGPGCLGRQAATPACHPKKPRKFAGRRKACKLLKKECAAFLPAPRRCAPRRECAKRPWRGASGNVTIRPVCYQFRSGLLYHRKTNVSTVPLQRYKAILLRCPIRKINTCLTSWKN